MATRPVLIYCADYNKANGPEGTGNAVTALITTPVIRGQRVMTNGQSTSTVPSGQVCACGCGQSVSGKMNYRTKQPIRFVHGHQNRMPEHKAAVLSGQQQGVAKGNYRKSQEWRVGASKAKIGKRNPMYGNVAHMRRIASNPGPRNGNYGKSARHGKGGWYRRQDGRTIWLRSTWEVRIAAWLDARELTWEYEPTRYVLENTTYAPDFWIEEFGCYWEVKGWFHKRHQKTVQEFRERYPDRPIVVLTRAVMRHIFGGSFK